MLEKLEKLKYTIKKGFAYKRTIWYLLRKRGIKAAYNFVFVKLFVKEGEGGLGLAYIPLMPVFRAFPGLMAKLAPYPFNVEIEITNRCNKRCILCEHTYWNEPNRDLSFEEFKTIVDQFPKLKWVNLTGEGDAFLNRDYLKMIEYLKTTKNIPVFLVDSFDLIREDIAEKLIKMGVDGIYISMDGATKETYEMIKIGCNFDKTLVNIKNLIRLKKEFRSPIPEICFRYIITTLNVHEMPQFVELVRSLGDNKSLGDGTEIEYAGLLVFNEVRHLFVPEIPEDILKATIEKSKKLGLHVKFSHAEKGKLPPLERCSAWVEPYIMMGGYVMPCCAVLQNNDRDFLRKYSLGNIFEKPFSEIWYSEAYRKFRKIIPQAKAPVPVLCKSCRAYDGTERARKYGIWSW